MGADASSIVTAEENSCSLKAEGAGQFCGAMSGE